MEYRGTAAPTRNTHDAVPRGTTCYVVSSAAPNVTELTWASRPTAGPMPTASAASWDAPTAMYRPSWCPSCQVMERWLKYVMECITSMPNHVDVLSAYLAFVGGLAPRFVMASNGCRPGPIGRVSMSLSQMPHQESIVESAPISRSRPICQVITAV